MNRLLACVLAATFVLSTLLGVATIGTAIATDCSHVCERRMYGRRARNHTKNASKVNTVASARVWHRRAALN